MKSVVFAVVAATLVSAPALGALPTPKTGSATVFDKVAIRENLNERIPLDLSFTDSSGKVVQLKDYFDGKQPVVLSLVYYRCPQLCNLVLSGQATAFKGTGLTLGTDYKAVTLSIDPTEKPELAAERRRHYMQAMGEPDTNPNWAFLTGTSEEIHKLASAVGFDYAYDEQLKQYAHAAAIFVLAPDGKITRYLYGVRFSPRDMRLSLVEASQGRVGTSFDRVLLTCFQYDPATRKYGWVVNGIIQGGGLAVFFALAVLLAALWRREIKRGTV